MNLSIVGIRQQLNGGVSNLFVFYKVFLEIGKNGFLDSFSLVICL